MGVNPLEPKSNTQPLKDALDADAVEVPLSEEDAIARSERHNKDTIAKTLRRAFDLTADHADGDGKVYFVLAPDAAAVKIGYSLRHPQRRIEEIIVGCPIEADEHFVLNGTIDLEQGLHRIFHSYRLHHEWFRYEGAVRVYVDYIRDQFLTRWQGKLEGYLRDNGHLIYRALTSAPDGDAFFDAQPKGGQ